MIRFLFLFLLPFLYFQTFSQSDTDYFIKAKIAEEYRKTDTAIIYITEALKQKRSALYFESRADLYLSIHNKKEALSDYLAASVDGSNEVNYKVARCYALMDSVSESVLWLKKYLTGKEKTPENIVKTDTVFKKVKDTNMWSDLWKKNWYDDYETYMGDIYYLDINNKHNELFEVLDSALTHYPEKADLWLWRAKAFANGNNPKEALKSLDNAIKFNPAFVPALVMRADISRKTGKSKKAVIDYSSLLEIQPWNVKYYKDRGNAKVESDDLSGAISDLLLYFSFDSLDIASLYNAAKATYAKSDVNGALNLFSKCILKNTGNSDYYYERGKCYYDLQENEKAYSDFCMAIDLRPDKGEYFYYRGLTYFALKNKAGACNDWAKAQSLDFIQAKDYMLRYCTQ